MSLNYASNNMKNKKNIVLTAVAQNPLAFDFILLENLKQDIEVNMAKNRFCFIWIVVPLLLYLPSIGFAIYSQTSLPNPETINSNPLKFSELRAREYYKNITYSNKVIGSSGNILTRNFIIKQLQEFKKRSKNNFRIEIEFQIFQEKGYYNLMNVLCRVSDPRTNKNSSSLLISTHYDAVFPSYGASDDGVGIVTNLEILRVLLTRDEPPKNPIIFIFVDGEEAKLLGSQAFKEHSWFKFVKLFLNTDSSGGPNSEIMFRLSPSSLIKLYSSVPYPHASSFGSFIVSFLPLGTDYIAYTENGLKGLDFAFYSYGYGYHTLLDRLDKISFGGIQHLGENQLAISDYIESNNILDHQEFDQTQWVFFDFIGKYLVYYSYFTSRLIEIFLIFSGILVLFANGFLLNYEIKLYQNKKMTKQSSTDKLCESYSYVLIYFFGYIFSIITGIIFSAIFSFLLMLVNPMAWYGSLTFSWILFGLSTLFGMFVGQWIINAGVGKWCCQRLRKHRPKIKYNGNLAKFHSLKKERYLALTLFWIIFLMIISFFGASFAYIVILYAAVVVPFSIIFFIIDSGVRILVAKNAIYQPIQTDPSDKDINKSSEHKIYWMTIPLITFIPCTISMDLFIRVSSSLVGLLGKVGFLPDISMAIPISLFTCFLVISYLPILHSGSNFGKFTIPLGLVCIIVLFSSFFVQPFSSEHPTTPLIFINHVNTFSIDSRNVPRKLEAKTFYTFYTPHSIIQKSLEDYRKNIKGDFKIQCTSDVCELENMPSPVVNNINIFKTANTIVSVDGEKKIQFSIEIVPDYPTRYSSIESKLGGNIFFVNDPDESKIIKKDGIYHKYGFNTKKWIIKVQIPFNQKRMDLLFLSTYCDLNLSPFLKEIWGM
eukprot:gene10152-2572_t